MVDIKFIAKQAGVSTATVSRVLNKSKPVSKELEKKVLDTVIKYQYYPNNNARLLANKRSYMIGILIEEQINQFHSFLLPILTKAIEKEGYQGVIHIVGAGCKAKIKAMEELEAKRMDGLIALFSLEEMEWKRIKSHVQIPFIYAEIKMNDKNTYDINKEAAILATQYLIDLGHKRIGGLFYHSCGFNHYLNARLEGFKEALFRAGLEYHDRLCIHGKNGLDTSFTMIEKLLINSQLPTAVFCESDELAIGAMFGLIQKGFAIPEDISIIGYDGIPLGKQIEPKLTTVEYPYEFWVYYIVKNLVLKIEKKPLVSLSKREMQENFPYIYHGDSCKSNK